MLNETDEVSLPVGDAFAPLDLLARVEPAPPAAFGGFHRLAVDDADGWARLVANLLAGRYDQGVIDTFEHAAARPGVEVALHGRRMRELLRQLPPLTAHRSHVKDRIRDRSQIGPARPPERRWRRQQRLAQRPFGIRQNPCVTQPFKPILAASDFSPGHRAPLESRKSEEITTC